METELEDSRDLEYGTNDERKTRVRRSSVLRPLHVYEEDHVQAGQKGKEDDSFQKRQQKIAQFRRGKVSIETPRVSSVHGRRSIHRESGIVAARSHSSATIRLSACRRPVLLRRVDSESPSVRRGSAAGVFVTLAALVVAVEFIAAKRYPFCGGLVVAAAVQIVVVIGIGNEAALVVRQGAKRFLLGPAPNGRGVHFRATVESSGPMVLLFPPFHTGGSFESLRTVSRASGASFRREIKARTISSRMIRSVAS